MKPDTIYVVGHKNPDTDSICSAIAYAEFCRLQGRSHVYPGRAGHLNRQTEFVLESLGVSAPALLADVYPRVRDVIGGHPATIDAGAPLAAALEIMRRRDIRMLPVVEKDGTPVGALILKRLPEHVFLPGEGARIRQVLTSPASVLSCLQAEAIHLVDADRVETLTMFVGAMATETFRKRLAEVDASVAVVLTGDREEIQRLVIEAGVRLLVVTGDLPVSEEMVAAARQQGVSILSSPFDTATSALLTRLSTPAGCLAEDDIPRVTPDERIDSLRRSLLRSSSPGAMVLDETGQVCGVATKTHLLKASRVKLILVDHNELTQAVPGADQVEILEVIDHHRLGNFHTEAPIRFTNQPLGSTCSIVATFFRQSGIEPSRQVAGLMLAGLLSDTVLLKSPTTTDTDRDLLDWLGEKAGIEPMEFGEKMFQAGSALSAYPSVEALLTADFKEYEFGERKVGVGQVEVVTFQEFYDRQEELTAGLVTLCRERQLDLAGLLVTDIVAETSLLLIHGDADLSGLIGYPRITAELFELKGVLSRKKQLLPHILRAFRDA
jgi:manganese-dependent inorganic pyrophosphatase